MSPLEAVFVNISRTALNSMCHVAVSQDESISNYLNIYHGIIKQFLKIFRSSKTSIKKKDAFQ